MRVTAIIIMLVLFVGLNARHQERQMQKPGEAQQVQPHNSTAVVKPQPTQPSAPRQMMPLGTEPVHAKPGNAPVNATPITPRPERKMIPLDPNKAVEKKN